MKSLLNAVIVPSVAAALTVGALTLPVANAAPFQNLNFEQAVVVINDPIFGHLNWSQALPGWSPWSGSPDSATVFYGSGHLGTTQYIMLVDNNQFNQVPIAGNYSLLTKGSMFADGGDAWISQVGDVPSTARAIELLVSGDVPIVSMNGNPVNLIPVGTQNGAVRYAGGISVYAGSTATLRINYPATTWTEETWDEEAYIASGGLNAGMIDNIQFSTRIVPEPSSCLLAGLGLSVLFGLAHRRRRK